jgi:hypothetical protein
MFTHCAHACVRVCVIKHSLIYGPILFKFAVNILQITTSSMGYVLVMLTHRAHVYQRARASAWLKHSLIFGRIFFKFAGHLLHMTTFKDYVLFMFTHCAYACVRVCVIKHSLIYGPILFKFAVNILQITTSSMSYVHIMFTHRGHEREQAHAWLTVRLSMVGLSSNLRWTYYKSQQVARATYCSYSRTARTRVCPRVVKHSIIFGRILFKLDVHILQMITSYMGYILIMFKHRVCERACAR